MSVLYTVVSYEPDRCILSFQDRNCVARTDIFLCTNISLSVVLEFRWLVVSLMQFDYLCGLLLVINYYISSGSLDLLADVMVMFYAVLATIAVQKRSL